MVKAGEKLGNYEVAEAEDGSAKDLGRGTGGITYLGRHVHLGSQVAIKVLIHRKNLRQKDRDAFLAEARAAASLSHPQIARILDFGESEQRYPYYVMELCEGGSLEDFRRKSGRPDDYTLVQWLFECAAALSYAHRRGILHRDIKPSNLLIARHDDEAVVKLIDFGLADIAGQASTSEQVIGTPHFAAPEQLLGHAKSASDVFSLGASFLWLITGKHLSQGDVNAVINDRLESTGYASALADVPAPWKPILGRMLETDPSRRQQDGEELLADVRAAFPHHSVQAIPWDPVSDSPWGGEGAVAASQWQDLVDRPWDELWVKSGEGNQEGLGVSMTAHRRAGNVAHDVLYFTDLSAGDCETLIEQGNLMARCALALGLGQVILEKAENWLSVAWPALSSEDALTWVRQGHNASTAEVLAALEPIAIALDEMEAGGLIGIDLHPSMLIVDAGPPLHFSLPVVLPVIAKGAQPGESSGTMRGASGASLAAHFASCTYQLLSGRTPPPAAFVNVRAYQATPKLTEQSNRFLSSAIAGTRSGATCRDVVNGLAYEERIPGATMSGAGGSRTVGPRHSLSSSSSIASRSNPTHIPPTISSASVTQASAVVPIPVSTPVAKAPAPEPLQEAKPAISQAMSPASAASSVGGKPKALLLGIAAALLVAAGVGGVLIMKSGSGQSPATRDKVDTNTSPANHGDGTPSVTQPEVGKGSVTETVRVPDDAATLREALAMCKEGGTIELSSGSYTEAIVLTKSVSLVSQGAVVLEQVAAGSSLVTVKGPVEIVMKNIQITDTRREATGDVASSPPLVLVSDGASLRFENCLIEGSSGDGISLVGKASATFTGSRIRKNRGFGMAVTSGSKVSISLSEVRENGLSGISALNASTKVTLGGGTSVSENGRHGVELGFGAELEATGAELNQNKQIGLNIQGGGSIARLEGGTVSGNKMHGAGVIEEGKLILSKVSIESNIEDGIYIESGGNVEIVGCRLVSNGKIGAYLVNGSVSILKVSDTLFSGHADAGVAVVGGKGDISGSTFQRNGMAVFYGKLAKGNASGNKVFPGPLKDSMVLEDAGEVIMEDNSLGNGEE